MNWRKKGLIILLTLCMMLLIFPVITLPVSASNDDYNVFDALGIDDSVTPSDFNPDNNDNPYGVSTVNIMPVSELFIADDNGKKLYGHNKTFLGEDDGYYEGETISSTDLTDGMSNFNAVSGDFTGNGLNSEIVVIGAGFYEEYEDIIENEEVTGQKLIDRKINTYQLFFDTTDESINPSNTKELKSEEDFGLDGEDFVSDKTLIYNYLKIAAGDFTGDGRDEIAVLIPEQDASKVMIYELQIPDGETAASSWSDADNWDALYSYYINTNGKVPNKVTLRASDFTGDGVDDLGIAWGIVDGDYKVKSKIKVLEGSKDISDRFEVIDVITDDLYKASFDTGDIDGDRKNELVVAGYPKNYPDSYIHLAYFEYDNDNEEFICRKNDNIDVLNNHQGDFITQLTIINKDGAGKKEHIYVEGYLFELADGSFSEIFGSRPTTIYEINSVDLTGNGKEELLYKRAYYSNAAECYRNQTKISKVLDNEYKEYEPYDNQKYAAFCNTDEDTVQMQFLGKRVVYSDPKILAVLASPPYFKDLEHLEGGDSYVGNSATTYGTSEGSSTTETNSSTISAGTYTSFEQEISFFGFSAASVEAEAEFSASWTTETEKTSSRTQTIEYSTAGGQDTVALYSIPLVIYEYETKFPVVDGDTISWKTQKSTITEPREATVRTYTLEAYDEIAKYYDILPTIGGTVLKHELGNPATYPTSLAGYRGVNQPDGPSIGVGYGSGGSISQTLELTEETSVGTSFSTSISTKVGGGAGGVTAGVTAGAESGSGTVNTNLNGKSFSTTIVGMPEEASGYGYDYNVKMFQHTKNYWGQSIPIVNYVVSELSMPPTVPADFGLDMEGTTSDQIELTWTDAVNGDSVVGYQIYKQYDFPDGASDFPIAFVEANEKDGNGVFSYIDTNLTPNSEYKYRIQVLVNRNPDRSVKSDLLTVKTRPAVGNPEISLMDDEDNLENNVIVYPDVDKIIKAVVTNSETNVGTPVFQWQKYVNGQWGNLSSETSDTLTFSDANLSVNGLYRLRVNQFVNENAVSVYSDVFSVEFAKRDAASEGITAVKEDNGDVTLSITLSNCNSNAEPTGNVVFEITGEGYSKTVVQALDDTQTAEVENLALPTEGLYVINAYYGGNKIFNSINITEKYLKGDATSYWLEVDDLVYGQAVSPVITEYKNELGGQTSTDITNDESYTIEYTYTNKEDNSTGDAVNVGQYSAEAVVKKDGETLATLTEDFSITQKQITITAPDLEKTESEAKFPDVSNLTADPNLVNDDEIEDLGLKIVCLDNSGREDDKFSPDDEDYPDPGRYTVRVITDENITDEERTKQSNYEITFVDGTFTVLGATHQVTMTADKLLDKSVGSIELISPEEVQSLEFPQNTSLTFRAAPDAGYEIHKWFVNGQEVDPTEENKNIFKYNMPGEAIDIVVSFKVKETNINFSAVNGTITCVEVPNLKTGDIVTKNGTFTFNAAADEGYHFVKWQKTENNKTSYPEGTTDGDGNPQIAVTIGDFDIILAPVFKRDSYQLNLSDNLRAYYIDDSDQKVYITDNTVVGDTEVIIEPAVGYEVSQEEGEFQWNSSAAGNVSQDGQSYTFIVTENTIVEAVMETEKLTGNIAITEGSFGDNEFVLEINGIETPYVPGENFEFESGDTITLEPILAYGAKVTQYAYNDSTSTDETLTLTGVTEDLVITASFEELDKYEIDFSEMDNRLHGSLDIEVVGQEVELEENNNLPVYKGDKVSITANPDSGYMVGYWTIDGIRTSTNDKSRMLEDITDNHKVICEFIPLVYYELQYSAGENGTVSVIKDDNIVVDSGATIGGGSEIAFTAAPNDGYMVKSWLVNNEVVDELGNKLTIILESNINTEVIFELITAHEIPKSGDNYSVTDIVKTPDELPSEYDDCIRDSGTTTFTVNPDEGYYLNELTICGVDCLTAAGSNESTTENIVAAEDNEDGSYTITVTNVKAEIDYSINSVVPVITIEEYEFGEITAEYSYIDENQVTQTITVNSGDSIPVGTELTVTANAESGYRFSRWGDFTDNSSRNPIKITVSNSDITLSGSFEKRSSGGGGSPAPIIVEEKNPVMKAVEEAEKNKDGKSVATVETDNQNSEGEYELEIPKEFFGDEEKILDVVTPEGKVSLPDDMFEESPDEDIQISIDQVDSNSLDLPEELKDKPVIDINLKVGGKKTKWASEDKEITVSIPYKLTEAEEAQPHKVIAVYIDDDGNITPLTSSSYNFETGEVVFKTKHTSYYSIQYVDKIFEDIGSYTWARESIEALAARGVINGVSETEFAPQNDITRADYVVLITRFLGLNDCGTTNFTDVESGKYYYDAVAAAKELGIVTGTGDNKFNPLEFISRQDMMVITERAFEIANIKDKLADESDKTIDDFADNENIAGYAVDSIDYLIRTGIVSGDGIKINPKSNTKRAEVAVLLYRASHLIN